MQPRNATLPRNLRDLAPIKGRIITADDAEYDDARRGFYGGIDKHPLAIVRASDAADVQRVVNVARERNLELAVRSGGHSPAGHSTTEGGILLDVRALAPIEIDAKGRSATVGAGATALEVAHAVDAHGLVIGFGDAGSVGVAGITLGGGVGYLTRKLGLTIDSLLSADVVTADGQLVHTNADEHPDLFWAIRGGGGNFGVATRFEFRLNALPEFTGGLLILPLTTDVIAGFVEAAVAAPEELSSIANMMPAPPMPFLPKELHGQLVLVGMMAYAGDPSSAERALAPFRALAKPLADTVKPMAYPGMYPPEDPSFHPTAIGRTMFADALGRPTAETIVSRLSSADPGMRVTQVRVLGGAASRIPADATAYAYRDRAMIVNVAAFYQGDEDRERRKAWVTEVAHELQPDKNAAYVNFLGDEGEARVRAAYPGKTWERLRKVKAQYDPSNLFRLNQNVPPA
jgi:FAD/FMN-containing dehydrogenase